MILLPALSSVNDILDTDLVLVEHSNGEGFKMTGADLKNFINAQATDEVETITGNTDVGGGTYIIKKVGKIVTLDLFGCSLPTGALYTLFTIPQRFRYSRMIIAPGFYGSGSVDTSHMLGYVIDQNGEVRANTSDKPLESSFPQLHTSWIID